MNQYQPTSLAQLNAMMGGGLNTGGLSYGGLVTPIGDSSNGNQYGYGSQYGDSRLGLTPQAQITQAINKMYSDGDPTASPTIGRSFESIMGFEPGWNTPQSYADAFNKAKNAVTGFLGNKVTGALSATTGLPLGLFSSLYNGIDYFGEKLTGTKFLPNLPSARLPNILGVEDFAAKLGAMNSYGLTGPRGSLVDLGYRDYNPMVSGMFSKPSLNVDYGIFGSNNSDLASLASTIGVSIGDLQSINESINSDRLGSLGNGGVDHDSMSDMSSHSDPDFGSDASSWA